MSLDKVSWMSGGDFMSRLGGSSRVAATGVNLIMQSVKFFSGFIQSGCEAQKADKPNAPWANKEQDRSVFAQHYGADDHSLTIDNMEGCNVKYPRVPYGKTLGIFFRFPPSLQFSGGVVR